MNLRQLSELLNLSQTTVSRALNGYPEVSETTRKRVSEAAAQHNYRPNIRARTLAMGRAMAIGHIIPMSQQNEMVNVVFADFIAGANEIYSRENYNMVLSVVRDEDEIDAYRGVVEKGAVDGVVLHAPTRNDMRIKLLSELQIPFIVHGRSTEVDIPYCWLDVNNQSAFEQATNFLTDLNHKRIALINGPEWMDFALRRRQGYLDGLAQAGIGRDCTLMRTGEMSESYGYQSAQELLSLPNPPTAFIASSIVPALGIRRAIEERGLVLGQDISILCYDDDISYLSNGSERPVYTALRSSVRDAGRRCAELLLEKISTPAQSPRTELWEAELILGTSTGPAP